MSVVRFWMQGSPDEPLELVGTVPAEERDWLVEAIRSCAPARVGGRSEPVIVVHVDRKEFAAHRKPLGPAADVRQFQVFPSAYAASKHLGYKYNEVALALGRAARKAEADAVETAGVGHTLRLRPEAVVRGVVLQYEKDAPEDLTAYPIEDAPE